MEACQTACEAALAKQARECAQSCVAACHLQHRLGAPRHSRWSSSRGSLHQGGPRQPQVQATTEPAAKRAKGPAPRFTFTGDTIRVLMVGDISGKKREAFRFIEMPRMPGHDVPMLDLVVSDPSKVGMGSPCGPDCRHAHQCMRCGAYDHPAILCDTPVQA